MNPRGILLYCLRAALFAAAVCTVYALLCHWRGRKPSPGRLLCVAYLAALIEITVLRGGVDWAAVFTGERAVPQIVPLRTTLGELRSGVWAFTYHTLGNLLWFAPLGLLLRRRKPWRALLAGAALSAAIELAQYLLLTGTTDIDDLLLNALGALLGWTMGRLIKG